MSQLYNEYDENPVHKTLKQRKRKKLKRKVKSLMIIVTVMSFILFLLSDLPRIKSIHITGLLSISEQSFMKQIPIQESSYYIFMNKEKVAEQIQQIPRIKKAVVDCDLFGHVQIEIEEAQPIAYAYMNNHYYEINDIGEVIETSNQKRIQQLKILPSVQGFEDLKLLKEFAKGFKDVPHFVQNEMNDIVLSPITADSTRLKCFMKENNIIYIRIEDLADKLDTDVFNYQAYKSQNLSHYQFSLEGDYLRFKPL